MSLNTTPLKKTESFPLVSEKKTKNSSLFENTEYPLNERIKSDGMELLKGINDSTMTACFFDPQYRGILDKMKYGNEGERQKQRSLLTQMSDDLIKKFIIEIDRTLKPSSHLFLWVDKFHLCQGIRDWIEKTYLSLVDMITWDKLKMGMGYRKQGDNANI